MPPSVGVVVYTHTHVHICWPNRLFWLPFPLPSLVRHMHTKHILFTKAHPNVVYGSVQAPACISYRLCFLGPSLFLSTVTNATVTRPWKTSSFWCALQKETNKHYKFISLYRHPLASKTNWFKRTPSLWCMLYYNGPFSGWVSVVRNRFLISKS